MGIHGDKSQQERDWVLNGEYFSSLVSRPSGIWHVKRLMRVACVTEFKHGKAPILIATDVASRGLG